MQSEQVIVEEACDHNTIPKHIGQIENHNMNPVPTRVKYQNNQDNQNKKRKTRKTNNNNNNIIKKQTSSDSQETILAQKYYINNLESKVIWKIRLPYCKVL